MNQLFVISFICREKDFSIFGEDGIRDIRCDATDNSKYKNKMEREQKKFHSLVNERMSMN